MNAAPLLFAALCIAQPNDPPYLALDPGTHTAKVWKLAFSPDGSTLYTAAHDKTVRVWDVATGACRQVLRPPVGPGRSGRLYAIAVSPDGRTLAIGGVGAPDQHRGRILLIDLATGTVTGTLDGHKDVVWDVAFSRDGKRLASGSDDNTARIWNLETRKTEHELNAHSQRVMKVAFGPSGRLLATGSYDNTARLWEVSTGREVASLEGHVAGIQTLAWSPAGDRIATGGQDHAINLFDTAGQRRQSFPNRGHVVTNLAFAGANSLVYTLGGSARELYTCNRIDLRTETDTVVFRKHNNTVLGGALSPDGQRMATSGGDSPDTYFWTLATGAIERTLPPGGRSLWGLSWVNDGQSLAWGSQRKPDTDFPQQSLDHAFNLTTLQFRPMPAVEQIRNAKLTSGAIKLQGGGDTTINVLRGDPQPVRLNVPIADDSIRCFTLVGTGRAVAGSLFGLTQFDTATGKVVRQHRGHTSSVFNVAPSPDGHLFASASEDQTLRVWRLDADEPLVSLFVAGTEWIAWTPEGYYACSPGGERLMGWHLNRGAERLAEYHPAERFRERLYRPDVIRRLLIAGSTEKALALADKERGLDSGRTNVGKLLPPEVSVTRPVGPVAIVREGKLEVRATAKPVGGRSVRDLQLLVDGRPYPDSLRAFEEGREAVWSIELTAGKHTVAALACNDGSEAASAELVVRYDPPGGNSSTGAKLYVLAVGVAEYQDTTLKLNYPAKDAEALATTLQGVSNPKPFPGGIVSKLLTNKDATREGILDALDEIAKKATLADCTLVYFSGHGQRDELQVMYLLPHDTNQKKLSTTALEGEALRARLSKVKGRAILMLDACHAGQAGVDKPLANVSDQLALELSRSSTGGVIVMCSSLGSQTSQESNRLRRSLYTHALIEGLLGKGFKGTDGIVYQHHLDAFVRDYVFTASKGEQMPTVAVPGNQTFLGLSKP